MQKVIYGAVFLIAFILVTGGLFFLNSSYRNIFQFDFAPAGTPYENAVAKKETKKNEKKESTEVNDSLKTSAKTDTSNIAHEENEPVKDSIYKALLKDMDQLQKENSELRKLKEQLAQNENRIQESEKIKASKADSSYTKWRKEMVKLYEKMDSRAAAKLLQTLNEDHARDILQIMKKKKAAEIISQLNPEVASKFVRFQ